MTEISFSLQVRGRTEDFMPCSNSSNRLEYVYVDSWCKTDRANNVRIASFMC
jgi:hypothetical protein